MISTIHDRFRDLGRSDEGGLYALRNIIRALDIEVEDDGLTVDEAATKIAEYFADPESLQEFEELPLESLLQVIVAIGENPVDAKFDTPDGCRKAINNWITTGYDVENDDGDSQELGPVETWPRLKNFLGKLFGGNNTMNNVSRNKRILIAVFGILILLIIGVTVVMPWLNSRLSSRQASVQDNQVAVVLETEAPAPEVVETEAPPVETEAPTPEVTEEPLVTEEPTEEPEEAEVAVGGPTEPLLNGGSSAEETPGEHVPVLFRTVMVGSGEQVITGWKEKEWEFMEIGRISEAMLENMAKEGAELGVHDLVSCVSSNSGVIKFLRNEDLLHEKSTQPLGFRLCTIFSAEEADLSLRFFEVSYNDEKGYHDLWPETYAVPSELDTMEEALRLLALAQRDDEKPTWILLTPEELIVDPELPDADKLEPQVALVGEGLLVGETGGMVGALNSVVQIGSEEELILNWKVENAKYQEIGHVTDAILELMLQEGVSKADHDIVYCASSDPGKLEYLKGDEVIHSDPGENGYWMCMVFPAGEDAYRGRFYGVSWNQENEHFNTSVSLHAIPFGKDTKEEALKLLKVLHDREEGGKTAWFLVTPEEILENPILK